MNCPLNMSFCVCAAYTLNRSGAVDLFLFLLLIGFKTLKFMVFIPVEKQL